MSFEVNYTLEDEQLFLTEPRFLRHEIIALLIYRSIVFYAQNTKLQILTVEIYRFKSYARVKFSFFNVFYTSL